MSKRKTEGTESGSRKTRTKAPGKDAAPVAEGNGKAPKEPKPELVVFAFRLKPEERDLIHRAAGPAKASKFVRALVTAASRKDLDTVRGIVEAIEA